MNEQTRHEVVRRWYEDESMRSIANALRLSRNTVSRVLEAHQRQRESDPNVLAKRAKGSSKLDAYESQIRDLLGRYPQITATRLHEELRSAGFSGGYTIVRQRLKELRPASPGEPVVRFETGPGEQAQMDWGVYDIDFTEEGRRRVNLFSYLLGYSRRQYLRFTESQDMSTLLAQHIRAFEHLDGVARQCLYDNMKTVVTRYDGDEPVLNTRFLAFATHYGFRPWPCRRGRPQTKGKVERPFDYIERNLLNARTFSCLDQLNELLTWWMANRADVRVHRVTKQRPIDRHESERAHLLPLPAQPHDTAEVCSRVVNAEGRISYRNNFYSAPAQHIGQTLTVRVLEGELLIYSPQLEIVARHELCSREVSGEARDDPAHRPRRDGRERLELLRQRFAELGAIGPRFLAGLIETRRYGKDEAQKVLALQGVYRREDLIKAMEHCVGFSAYSLRSVQRVLGAHATPRPPIADEPSAPSAITEGPRVAPRETGDYSALVPEEPEEPEPPKETNDDAEPTQDQQPPEES